jgi:hypothetical protein
VSRIDSDAVKRLLTPAQLAVVTIERTQRRFTRVKPAKVRANA